MTAELTEVALWRVRLALRHPLRAAHGTETDRELIVVQARFDDGTEGWGECSALRRATYTSEYVDGAWAILRDELVPAALAGRPAGIVGHPMARAGLATALADAALRLERRSLAEDLAGGGEPATAVPRCAVVGRADSIDALVRAVGERLAEGPAMVKVKVTPAAADLAAVAAVRTQWPDLPLAVDFNGTADAAAMRTLGPLDLAYIEQPAPADALVASAHLAQLVGAPVALDESITSAAALDAAVALAAGAVANIKPARCGGPHGAASLLRRARNAGWGAFVGGMLESGIGRAAALAVAALPGCTLPTDLGPSAAYFDLDLTAPITLNHAGSVVVPTGPGIGRTPVAGALEAATTERLALAR